MTEPKAPPTRVSGNKRTTPNAPAARPRIDASDVLVFCGLLLLGAGLWWLSPPAALIVVGVVLLIVGLVGAWLRGKRAEPPPPPK